MHTNQKIILIILLGVSASLFSFVSSQYFAKKNQRNQLLLSQIQQVPGKVELIRELSKAFIQNGAEDNWSRIMAHLEHVRTGMTTTPDADRQWDRETQAFTDSLAAYHQILTQIHDPAIRLKEEKLLLQGIGLSFTDEVESRIIAPYRKEEGLRIYRGDPIDPFKARIKDTAYDLTRLHLHQQVILLELLLNWDIAVYQNKKQTIAQTLESHSAQLQYLKILMGDSPDIQIIIDSLAQKLANLVHHEETILDLFSSLDGLTQQLTAAGDRLLDAGQHLSNKIVTDTSEANQLNGMLNWAVLIAILTGLGLLGAMLAADIIRFVEDLKKSREQVAASESNLRVTLDAIGDAVIATDDCGLIARMNPTAERLTGWALKDAIEKPLPEIFRIVNAKSRNEVANPVDKVLAEGTVVGLANHTLLIARNGSEYQIADSAAPIRAPDGRIIGVVLVFRDVTETYAREQKIRENEKRLKALTANVPGVVYQFKATTGHVYTNDFVSERAMEIFGLDSNPLHFFDQFSARIPDDEKSRFMASIHDAVETVTPWHYEGRFNTDSGKTIWFSGHSSPRREGEAIVFYGVLMDITQRRQLEESLRLTQYCVDNASIGIFRIGDGGQILGVNQHACRSLGYSEEELLKLTVFDIDPNFDQQRWPAHLETLKPNRTRMIESLHRHKDGRVFPVQVLINLVVFEGQQFHIAYAQDITERKRWENDLAASERRYRDLFNEAPVMYVITENRQGRPYIVDVNNLFLDILGYDRQEVIGTPLAGYYCPESSRAMLDDGGYLQALDGRFNAAERRLIAKDGRAVDTLLHALPERDGNGHVVGTRAMFLDVTARKAAEMEARKLETALAQAQKMEAIGTLAGGIAHDFNNILAAVMGYTQLALRDTDEKTRLHYQLSQIFTASVRAADLVRQILTFSRQAEHRPKPLQVGPLVKEALNLLRSSLPTTIEIKKRISEHTGSVMADPTQIHQIVMNLCTNAAQSMEDGGGRLTVILEQVHLSAAELQDHPGLTVGDYVRLSVEDTGTGIAPEIMEMIFNPYFTTKASGKGTGLGLSVVHGIVKRCGGGVYVRSSPGAGTTFDVLFPVIKEQALAEKREQPTLPAGTETILFVDDESILVELGQEILQMLGYQVIACTDSLEALDVFKRAPDKIDLVITDLTMPKMTGDKLALQMLKMRPGLPIILCTGFSSHFSEEVAEKIGVKAIAQKPLVAEKLATTIRNVLTTV